MNIVLNLNSTEDSLDLIKYCALYFDKLSIDSPIDIDRIADTPNGGTRIDFTTYLSDSVLTLENVLKKEGLCIDDEQFTFGDYTQLAKRLVAKSSHLFFSPESFVMHKNSMTISHDAEIISDEAKQAISEIITQKERNRIHSINEQFGDVPDVPDFYLVLTLYKGLVDLMLSHIEKGANVITNSSLVDKILLDFYASQNKNPQRLGLKYNFAQIEATRILLPFVPNAPIDDILEIRYKANDELLELRNYVETTLGDLAGETILNSSSSEIRSILNQKITPAINQFERKLAGLHVSTAQEFIKNMQNPLSYVPMCTTFFTNIPANVSLGLSLGMISLETILQHKAKQLEAANDPLYFTIKLRNQLPW